MSATNYNPCKARTQQHLNASCEMLVQKHEGVGSVGTELKIRQRGRGQQP